MATPRDFPSLMSVQQRRSIRNGRPYHVCSVCGLTVEPRNGRAHARKCARLKRQDPALHLLWRLEMRDTSDANIRKSLGTYRVQLTQRGLLLQGPLTRKGSL